LLVPSLPGRTVAQLEDPFGDRSNMISFTHDGTRLIVSSTYASAIHVWDLRAIRKRLKTMNLDWDWPEFPLVVPSSDGSPPLRFQVLGDGSTRALHASATNAFPWNP
jgi:hypothetical protein